ncbi:MAG: tRNA (adenosine(37)-N6)-threonylcarbamoyltransferase complex transferase subunit TsaD [Clostridia bacterium]|nr:tRNA (adenosine(37)-N6)-threonylcarbamoyltransferase complex transferase subunit TsaD [Clostridia bacterium]
MYILAFESSCDETSASVVEMSEQARTVKSNIVASQVATHALYGGVVPEIASRAHIEAISSITYEALEQAGLTLADISAIAVTNEPGLIGAVLVGVNFAKSLAYANGLPIVPVNHIKAHVAAAYLDQPELKPPFLALVVSGGHTSLFEVSSYTDFKEIGATRDDAAGESFDKVGRVMGLPYPGGAAMDRLATEGNAKAIRFPSPAIPDKTLDFSFSGLKTAVINHIHNAEQKGAELCRADVAASFTAAVCGGIAEKLTLALNNTGMTRVVMAGGVAANSHLRATVSRVCREHGATLFIPPITLCGDNGAMVGAQGYYEFLAGNLGDEALNGYPS